MGKKEFVAVALDPKSETFVVHIASLGFNVLPSSSLLKLDVHLFWRPQISGLITEKAFTKVLAKYSNFADVFSSDLTSELSKQTEINNHAIELVDD